MTNSNGELQPIQVVPVQAAGAAAGGATAIPVSGGQLMLQAPQQTAAQVIQTADGQSLIYQPVQVGAFL